MSRTETGSGSVVVGGKGRGKGELLIGTVWGAEEEVVELTVRMAAQFYGCTKNH